MMGSFRLIHLIPFLGSLLLAAVFVAGIIISSILINRKAGRGAVLALIGFILLLINSLCGGFYTSVMPFMQMRMRAMQFPWLGTGASCLQSLLLAAGMILIILGIWNLAVRRAAEVTLPPRVDEGLAENKVP